MSLATQLLGWIKSRPARVGRAFKTKHPVVFNHMGVAAPLLLLIGWLVIYASVVLDILPDFADPIEAVLLGAYATAFAGVILFASARTLEETGVREVLAVDLDRIANGLEWPDALSPPDDRADEEIVRALRPTWEQGYSAEGFEAVKPKLVLLPSKLIARTLQLFDDLKQFHGERNRPSQLNQPLVKTGGVSPKAKDRGLEEPANRRAALALRAAELARDLGFTTDREERAADLRRRLETSMPNALREL